jgi:creatinine amidohydrolase
MNDFNMNVCLSRLGAVAFAKIASTAPVILLPLGSHEDHGPHLPMGDFRLAELLAIRIARDATRQGVPSFVAPTLPFGVADYFGCSAGGLALSAAGFAAVLEDLLKNLLDHGLTRIVLLNGHGGNVPVIHQVTSGIRGSAGPVIPSFYLWKAARQIMEQEGVAATRFGHGAEPLLSITSALAPEAVVAHDAKRPASPECLALPVSGFGTVAFEGITVEVPTQFDQVPLDPIAVAWPQASATLGQRVCDKLVATAGRFVVHFARAASSSGVSKSRSTESLSTDTSETDSI